MDIAVRTRLSLSVLAWLTIIVLMLALAPSRADAETTEHSYTRDGLTATWNSSDFSDLTVTDTPATADSSASSKDSYVGNAIIDAWEYSTSALQGSDHKITPYAPPNGCSYSPDSWGAANFRPTCDSHDICYSSTSDLSRKLCDQRLRYGLRAACDAAYPDGNQQETACLGAANTYYRAVRIFGRSHYEGTGDPA